MHVLYLVGQDAGGLPHYTAELANSVADHADVTVMKPRETTADEVFRECIDVRNVFSSLGVSLPRIYRREIDPRAVLRGIASYDDLRAIRDVDADVVHDTTDLFPHVKFFLKRHGIDGDWPLVVTRHEVEQHRFSLARPHHFAENLVDFAIPDLDVSRTIVHTENQKRVLVERGRSPESVSVVPHGTYSLFGDHTDLDGDPDSNTLLFFGHVVPHKGIETLVRAVPKVARELPDVTLIIAGDGKIPRGSQSIIDANSQHFEVHNRHVPNDEVRTFFERSELVVLPYHEREGQTNGHSGVLSTAMSFGKPVVASMAGEFPSLVEGRGCGKVVPSRDPDRLASEIVRVLSDDDLRAELARNSRRLGRELSWETVGRKHVAIYDAVRRERSDRFPADVERPRVGGGSDRAV